MDGRYFWVTERYAHEGYVVVMEQLPNGEEVPALEIFIDPQRNRVETYFEGGQTITKGYFDYSLVETWYVKKEEVENLPEWKEIENDLERAIDYAIELASSQVGWD